MWCEDGDHLGFDNLLVVNIVSGETAIVLFSFQLLLILFIGGSGCLKYCLPNLKVHVVKTQS